MNKKISPHYNHLCLGCRLFKTSNYSVMIELLEVSHFLTVKVTKKKL
jgi:hypothetical protein